MTKELARNYFIVCLIGMFLAFLFKTTRLFSLEFLPVIQSVSNDA